MASDREPLLLLETQAGIKQITLNRPESLNGLSFDMITALQTELDVIANDENIRGVILKGAGRGFSAGHDLKEITRHRQDADKGRQFYDSLFSSCTRMMQSIQKLPVPVIAQVHGVAAAAGCQLVASCDLAVADEATKFGVNGINSGLFCSTPQIPLSRNIPRKIAMEMLLLGEIISARRAENIGLINRVTPYDELEATVQAFAKRITEKSRHVASLGKQAFYAQAEMNMADAYAAMNQVIVDNLMHADAVAGIQGFIDKRPVNWPSDLSHSHES